MRKGKSLIGMRVISESDGADLGRVKDLIFDHDANFVLALLMSEKDLFGLVDAQVIPWSQLNNFGPDALTAASANSRVKAGDVEGVKSVMHRNTALSGTRVYTTDGRNLGTLADTFIDEASGHIEGYELSGGFVADTMTGKKFLPANFDFAVGRDVALVSPSAADGLTTHEQQPGGLQGATQGTSQSILEAYDAAKEKISHTYGNIFSASIEKQQLWVVGKTAGHDVAIADESLVRKGEIITSLHAGRATAAGVLGSLVAAAVSGAAEEVATAGRAKLSGAVATGIANTDAQAQAAVMGKPAAHVVLASDGSVIVEEGHIVTQEILENAKAFGRDREVIASAGFGAASQAARSAGIQVSESAANLWGTAKQKMAAIAVAAQEKKVEMDAHAQQTKINHALGRHVTRVILDRNDAVILRSGDIISNAAIARAREAEVLDVLLASVSDTDPEITVGD